MPCGAHHAFRVERARPGREGSTRLGCCCTHASGRSYLAIDIPRSRRLPSMASAARRAQLGARRALQLALILPGGGAGPLL